MFHGRVAGISNLQRIYFANSVLWIIEGGYEADNFYGRTFTSLGTGKHFIIVACCWRLPSLWDILRRASGKVWSAIEWGKPESFQENVEIGRAKIRAWPSLPFVGWRFLREWVANDLAV